MRIRGSVTFAFVTVSLAGVLGMATAARAQFSADSDTVALWHFDDGTGSTAVDAAGNGFDLSLGRYPGDGSNGAVLPTWVVRGCFDGAIHFAKGTDDYSGGYAFVYHDLTFVQNELTAELWFKTTSNTAELLFFGFIQFHLFLREDGILTASVGDGANYSTPVASTGVVNDGLWHYAAVTYDGANVRLFVDGQPNGVAAFSGTIGPINPYPLAVGGHPFNSFLDGTIDEVRVSDVARTSTAIGNSWDQLSVLCPEPAQVEESYAALALLFCFCRRKTRRTR